MNKELLKYFGGDELAANVWKSKYATKDENTPKDMHIRLSKEFARIEKEYNYKEIDINKLSNFGKELLFPLNEEYILSYLDGFKFIIPQGSIMSILGNIYVTGSLSNCFVVPPPHDSYGGILKTDEHLVQLMKRRGGVGTNLNYLRPDGSLVTNAAGNSTGSHSFMDRYSNTTREVAQNGRRGALMLLMSCLHPDIFKFVTKKKDRTKVTGANISAMLTDKFMEAAEKNEDFICYFPFDVKIDWHLHTFESVPYNELINYKGDHENSFQIMKIHARELFDLIVEMAWDNAEPGVAFIDRIEKYCPEGVYPRFIPIASNPCVIGETEILTKDGYKRIDSLVNKEVEIWNGLEWSLVIPKITGNNQHVLKVTLSDGRNIICTDYHKWILNNNKRVETINLKIGDKLQKYNFPIIEGGENMNDSFAYTQGFISADGQDNYKSLWLYEPKFICENRLNGTFSKEYTINSGVKRKEVKLIGEYEEKSFIPFNWNYKSKINWLSGLLDGDGTELIEGGVQLWSINLEFLENLQKLLSLLSVNSKILKGKDEEYKLLPNGKGGESQYFCKKSYRICIGSTEIQKLKDIGLKCERLSLNKNPNRSAQRFVTIKSIEDYNYVDTVYCFTDSKNHSGVFNGIMTANCGEQWLNAYDSCRLLATNLFSMIVNPFTKDAYFDFDKWYEISYIQQRLADDIVDLEIEYVDRIINKIKADKEPDDVKRTELELWENIKATAKASRRTGCGFTGMGDMLAAIGYKYDSKEALELVEKVMKTKMAAELDCTIDLAIMRGTFEGWDSSLEFKEDPTMEGLIPTMGKNHFYRMLLSEFKPQCKRMNRWGRRNSSWSTVAPTGTVSLMTQTTSGLEPLFSPYYFRNKKVNPNDKYIRVDYTDQNGDSWTEYPVLHPKFKDWISITLKDNVGFEINDFIKGASKETINQLYEDSPYFNSTANDISWEKRVELQSIIQKYTTNAISSTINLPEDVKKEVISNIYMESWKKGLKGVTVYRDKCRTGVLVTDSNKKEAKFEYRSAVKRPKELPCEVHHTTAKGKKWTIVVGLYDGKPYEVFGIEQEKTEIPEKLKNGFLVKEGRGSYTLMNDKYTIKDVTNGMTDEEEALTRMISTALRHGSDIEFISNQLNKANGSIVSFNKAVARILSKYTKKIENGLICNECGSNEVVKEEGCSKCRNCGNSKCG